MCILYRIYIHTYLPTRLPTYLPPPTYNKTTWHTPSESLAITAAQTGCCSPFEPFNIKHVHKLLFSILRFLLRDYQKTFRAAWQCCDVLWGKWNSQCPRITCGWFPTPYDKKWPHSLAARLHQRLKRFPAVNSIHCHQIFWWYLVMIWVMSNKDIICYFWYTIFRIGNDWKMEMIGFPFLDAWWGGFICHWFADSSR